MATIIDQLILHEAIRLFPYDDQTGKQITNINVSIGIGCNLSGIGITREEAIILCQNRINECVLDLESTFKWYAGLSDIRKRVCIDMRYNLGLAGFFKFKKFIVAMEHGFYSVAASEITDSTIADGRKKRLAKMMSTGLDYDDTTGRV